MSSPPDIRHPLGNGQVRRSGGATDSRTAQPSPASTDGRQLRRMRNREAVVEALLDLYREGNLSPNAEQIAARSGLSPRSLFRYFDDVDDLIRAAIHRQQAQALPLVLIDATPESPFHTKVAALVEQRFRLYDAVGNAATVARLRAPFSPVLDDTLRVNRDFLRSQMANLFAPELAGMEGSAAALAAADVVTSFESRHLLLDDQGLTPTQAKAVMAGALSALLSSGR